MHKIPIDLQKVIISNKKIEKAWESITVLGKNEWICWIESAKKLETRSKRISRTVSEIQTGKRRPCCWAGCVHR